MPMHKGFKFTTKQKRQPKGVCPPQFCKPRYYKTPYNESLKVKDSFTIPETQEFITNLYVKCDEYLALHSESQGTGYKRRIGSFVLSLDKNFDIKTVDKKFFSDFYIEHSGLNTYVVPFLSDILSVYFRFNQEYCWNTELCEIANGLASNYDNIKNFRHLVMPFLLGDKDIHRSRLLTANSITNGNPIITIIDFDTDDTFIQDLLFEYHNSQHDVQPRVYHLDFFEHFAESLGWQLPSDIYGFNIDTLIKQETFFAAWPHREAELENRFFYRFIMQKQGNNKTISPATGVSIGYLMSESFATRFLAGYHYVPFSPNENYPSFDKWAISPNGLDTKTSMDKPETIRYLDFSRIPNETIRSAAKAWFWGEAKAGFENRCRNINYIMEFFEYRENLRSMYFDKFIQARVGTDLDIKNTILAEEIISYTSEWNERVTEEAYRTRISPLRMFLQYMNDMKIYKTETAAFEYLVCSKHGKKKGGQEILPLSKEDFRKLVNVLEKKAQNNTLHMLYYIVFCLNTLTPLRISSILDLDYNCVTEKSKGIYAVSVKVKTSDGDEKHIQISKEVKRLIDVAVSLTSQTRMNAPDNLKHYLFLVNNQKDFYRSIPHQSYNRHLQNCCTAVGIPLISAQNLRKTYYTNLVENAIRNNVSLMSLKELTGHSNIDTTENYYVKENIRNYLEATYGVEIGNMPIVGEVVVDYPEAKHEDIVNEGCGYCRNPECNVLGTANCLMCKGFVTTPKHIPQFEEAINVLSRQITENENLHDKEHLYAVKRLYAAYLEQLYIRKEKLDNETTD